MLPGFSVFNFKHPASLTGLRWTKSDTQSAVTWCYNHTNNPTAFSEAQLRAEVELAVQKIAAVCGIIFIENVSPPCDIEVTWDTAGDGAGGTLGFVYQPSVGDDMAACGICGDQFIDDAEAWGLADFHNVVLHELGHSVGLDHTTNLSPAIASGDNRMDPFYNFGTGLPRLELGPSDKQELIRRYGKP